MGLHYLMVYTPFSIRRQKMKNNVRVKKRKYNKRDNRNGFLFALPWIIGFLCFSVIPLFTSLYYSFTDFNPVKDPVWVGLDNFKYVFQDPLVYKGLKNTLFMAFVSTPVNLFIALLLATLLNRKFKGRGQNNLLYALYYSYDCSYYGVDLDV